MDFLWMRTFGPAWGTGLVIGGYLLLLLWVLARPRSFFLHGAPDRRAWRDLRLWIVPIVLVQVWLYWVLR